MYFISGLYMIENRMILSSSLQDPVQRLRRIVIIFLL